MIRLRFSRDWKPYFEGARNKIVKGKINRGDMIRELGDIYSGRTLQNHSKRLGQPVISENDVELFKEMRFTLDELEKKLPFLRIKLNSGEVKTVKDIIETYRRTGDVKALSRLAEIKSEKRVYSTKPGQNVDRIEFSDSWFDLEGHSLVGTHGKIDGAYVNFDSFSIVRHASVKGEVIAINLQDGVTHTKRGHGYSSSNNVNHYVKDYHLNYDWDAVLDNAGEGNLSFDGYLDGLKKSLISKKADDIDGTTLSVLIIIRTEDKVYMAGNMINGNSPVVRINGSTGTHISDYDKFQLRYDGIARLSDVFEYFDGRKMTVSEVEKGDILVVGSDGIKFMEDMVDSIRDNEMFMSSTDNLYKKTEDDGTVVIVKIKE